MSSTHFLLSHSFHLPNLSSTSIEDGCTCHVVGHNEANLTSLLLLSHVLYVPNFFFNLLFINAIP